MESEAMTEWQALPKNSGTAMRQVQLLGKIELFDKNLSVNRNMACSSCHMPYTGFSGPISSVNATTVAYPGSVQYRFGKRKPQGYTYSPNYPVLQYNRTQQDFYGGNFWDLRATGFRTQSPDAEQAQDPPHDSQEMGLPDAACVVYRIAMGAYADVFTAVWGPQAFQINWPSNADEACNKPQGAFGPNQTPLKLSAIDRGKANAAYDQYALAITAYESSPDISPFSSKFDQALANADKKILSADELAGWALFRGKAKCNTCHLDGTENTFQQPSSGSSTTGVGNAAGVAPLFTDFTSSNLGLPRNPDNPFYYQDVPDSYGFTPNPQGKKFVDLGVGLFLRGRSGTPPDPNWAQYAPQFDGKMQVSTLRNVDMRPSPTFVKAYMHNGYLKSLKEVVHFYNTRDVYKAGPGGCTAATEKKTCWPAPEVTANVDTTVGNLGLTDHEEDLIVLFMQTLTDGVTHPYPGANAYTGN
jgi:cytochrome c peroxidase